MRKQTSDFLLRYMPLLSDWIRFKLGRDEEWLIRKNILSYYGQYADKEIPEDIKPALKYIKRKGSMVFPYPFGEKYKLSDIKVYVDKESGMRYVLHEGHPLYFKRGMRAGRIRIAYAALLREQDNESPHRYQTPLFSIGKGAVFFDIGSAEGVYSLSLINLADKIYLLEANEQWIEALEKTFSPWKDKVTIINKFVSDKESDTETTIDSLTKDFSDGTTVVLKVDVEGAEKSVLEGAERTLTSGRFDTKAIICTYHRQNDHHELSAIMDNYGFNVETSRNYMLFTDDTFAPPYFRHGLIYCYK